MNSTAQSHAINIHKRISEYLLHHKRTTREQTIKGLSELFCELSNEYFSEKELYYRTESNVIIGVKVKSYFVRVKEFIQTLY